MGRGGGRERDVWARAPTTEPPSGDLQRVEARFSGVFERNERRTGHGPLAALAHAARSGCRRSESELLRRLMPPLRRYLRRFPLEGDSEDFLQESLSAFAKALADFRGQSSVVHFAIQVTKRVSAMRHRERERRRQLEARAANLELPLAGAPDNPHSGAVSARQRRALSELFDALPPVQAEVIRLRIVEERSIEEISALTRAPPRTVRTRVRRALRRLRALVEANAERFEIPGWAEHRPAAPGSPTSSSIVGLRHTDSPSR